MDIEIFASDQFLLVCSTILVRLDNIASLLQKDGLIRRVLLYTIFMVYINSACFVFKNIDF